MQIEVQKAPNDEITIKVALPVGEVENAFQEIIADAAKTIAIDGFRQGKAPLTEVEKRLDQGELNGRVINHLVPHAYAEAVKQKSLHPVADPRIEIKKFARGNEFIFEIKTCEVPEVKLGGWKAALENLAKKNQIATAATLGEAKAKAATKETEKKIGLDEVLRTVTEAAEVAIPELLIEDEVSRMLSRLHDHLDTLGLAPDEYLKSRGQNREALRREYAENARRLLKMEFVLAKLAAELKIGVEASEIDAAINAAPDQATKASLQSEANRIYLQALIRKNKTMEKLMSIANGQ